MTQPAPHGTSCVALVPLFADLTAEEQDEVAACARPVRRGRGEQVQRPTDPSAQLLVVHRGELKISHHTGEGREQIVRLLRPGDFVGESAFVTGAPVRHTATALSDVELCSFDHRELDGLVTRYPGIALRMLATLTERLQVAEQRLTSVASSDVEARLAAYLLDIAEDRSLLRLPLAKKDIASILGTTPETLSRRMSALGDRGLVAVSGREVRLLDVPRLRSLAGRAAG